MANFSLGIFSFVNLEGIGLPNGAPETVRQTAMAVQRPGVPGTGWIQTAIKGRPFQMRSFVDVASSAAAQILIVNYEAVANTGLLKLIHAGTDYSATPVRNKYWVMDVQAGWRRTSVSTGYPVVVEAVWTLVPHDVSE